MSATETPTVLLYLSDTYKLKHDESVIVGFGQNEKGTYVLLNETVFHPQGGGQPSDVGSIEIDNQVYQISFVASVNGVVYHYFNVDNVPSLETGKMVKLNVNEEKRLNHAKAHTGGHLLSCVVEKLAPELKGVKGHHFLDGPYVEFQGKLTTMSNDELIHKSNEMIAETLSRNAEISVSQDATNTKRIVQINGFEAIPCGGTHLKNVSELKQVSIRKINASKGNTKISYSFI